MSRTAELARWVAQFSEGATIETFRNVAFGSGAILAASGPSLNPSSVVEFARRIDAFIVQNNIDLASGITAPLTGTLMRFMLKVDSIFLQDYIAYVERTCSVDGVIHKTSFVANFLSLLEDIRNQRQRHCPPRGPGPNRSIVTGVWPDQSGSMSRISHKRALHLPYCIVPDPACRYGKDV